MLRSLFLTTTSNARRVRKHPVSSSSSSCSTSSSSQMRSALALSSQSQSQSLSRLPDPRSSLESRTAPRAVRRFHDRASNLGPGPLLSERSNRIVICSSHSNFPRRKLRLPHSPARTLRRCYGSSPQHRTSPAFVSKHNQSINVSSEEILDYCAKHNGNALIEGAKTTRTHVILRECPFCTKPTRNDHTNLYKLHIQIGGGAFFCHRCGTGGSWYDLKARFGGFHMGRGMSAGSGNAAGGNRYNRETYRCTGGGMGRNDGDGWDHDPHGRQPQPQSQHYKSYQNEHNAQRQGTYQRSDYDATGGAAPCLPMPPTRLSGLYSSRLLDDIQPNQNKENDKSNSTVQEPSGSQQPGQDESKHSVATNDALRYLTEVRGLTPKTLRKYGVGRAAYRFPSEGGGYQEAECVTFPWIMRESDVQVQEALRGAVFELGTPSQSPGGSAEAEPRSATEPSASSETTKWDADANTDASSTSAAPTGPFVTRRIKARALERKSWQRLDPPGGGWGLFGLHTVPADCTSIVLTEGEYDAMAVHQATGLPAVSLPNGCRSLPLQVLPLLERFDRIVLWMDADEPGKEGAEKFAKKLGINRTYLVDCPDAKDANDALLKGTVDMARCIDQAKLMPHDRIVTFGDLRNDVLKELLEPELYSGTPVTSLPKFTQLIKGFRRGEMTVLTGPTGCGKTTFLGQVSLDMAEQGENVLWGSFEIKNTRLLHKLLKQFSRDSLPISTDANAREKFEALADRFENLSLYFMKFHGGSDVDEVLDAMEYAVYVNDVEHIILDNMQFMITRHKQKTAWDKFEVQDIAIEKFRKFATEHNVHVTLVVHPRKEDETSKLSISSFFGSAKATQEADTVIIIQNDANRRKYLDVKKNRFDGTLGYTPIYFQNRSGRYVEDEGSAGNRPPQTPKEAKKDVKPKEGEDLERHWDSMFDTPNSKRA